MVVEIGGVCLGESTKIGGLSFLVCRFRSRLADPCELALPSVGLVELEDPETGARISVDTSSSLVRQRFAARAQKRMKKQELLFGRVDMDWIDLRTDRDYVPDLVRFFQARERRQLL